MYTPAIARSIFSNHFRKVWFDTSEIGIPTHLWYIDILSSIDIKNAVNKK
ncbi:unnamed protein product [Meloidogyne enterolobii]|uniref:Uncharacterized protein n=1 Tax=Meloidogyne enterolobii TaxID=390850 RepID=A0ACB0ZXZ3_MELEN